VSNRDLDEIDLNDEENKSDMDDGANLDESDLNEEENESDLDCERAYLDQNDLNDEDNESDESKLNDDESENDTIDLSSDTGCVDNSTANDPTKAFDYIAPTNWKRARQPQHNVNNG
jgi:hypothetical protein